MGIIVNSTQETSKIFRKMRKSWDSTKRSWKKDHRKCRIAPEGCFPVYVGAERQRFVIKTEYASHPLFITLLEEAEREHGYKSDGPLSLPGVDVDLFYKVLAEMEEDEKFRIAPSNHHGLFSKSLIRLPGMINSKVAKGGCGSYSILTPSPLLKMNI